jgi:hypothetical protein
MVAYLIKLANGIVALLDDQDNLRSITRYASALSKELKKLDPRDFICEAQYDFIVAMLELDDWVLRWSKDVGDFLNEYIRKPHGNKEVKQKMEKIVGILEKYGGEGWRSQTRSFSFIKSNELRAIIERDYKELILVLFPGRAWKSTVIMAGSILEASLYDLLTSDPSQKAKALASPVAPKKINGKVLRVEDWKLEGLIKVASDIAVLPKNRADTFDQVLRDYRNFVHPRVEIKSAHPCREGEAQLAIGGLNAICDILEAKDS